MCGGMENPMSSQVAIISLLAIFLSTTVIFAWMIKLANEQRERIVKGVDEGVPLSDTHRRLVFSNDWLGFKFLPIGMLLTIGYGLLLVGQRADDADVRVVSFIIAFVLTATAVFAAVLGVSDLVFIRSVLRQTKRN